MRLSFPRINGPNYVFFFPQIRKLDHGSHTISSRRLTRAFQDRRLSLCKNAEKGDLELRKHTQAMDMRGALVAQ